MLRESRKTVQYPCRLFVHMLVRYSIQYSSSDLIERERQVVLRDQSDENNARLILIGQTRIDDVNVPEERRLYRKELCNRPIRIGLTDFTSAFISSPRRDKNWSNYQFTFVLQLQEQYDTDSFRHSC